MDDQNILSLKGFGVAYADKVILGSVDMTVPHKGIYVLIGPAGTGKSTLIRTLAGFNSMNSNLRTWGKAKYAGAELNLESPPALVMQNARFLMANVFDNIVYGLPEKDSLNTAQKKEVVERLLERAGLDSLNGKVNESIVKLPLGVQRHIAIARTIASNPALVMIDEPTTDVEDDYCDVLLNYIHKESQNRAILVVLHNRLHAQKLGGKLGLLAGGYVQEEAQTDEFFKNPQTQPGKDYVWSGSCSLPAPDTPAEELSEIEPVTVRKLPEAAKKFLPDSFGPRNFLWLMRGEFAGTPRPGLVVDMDYDLAALKRVGIGLLVSLTTKPVDPEQLKNFDIQGLHFPIKDMGAPEVEAAYELVQQMDKIVKDGTAVAYHCKAGLGRTGTMLACQLIYRGHSALDALETARRVEPRWVQSQEQADFLETFANYVANRDGHESKEAC